MGGAWSCAAGTGGQTVAAAAWCAAPLTTHLVLRLCRACPASACCRKYSPSGLIGSSAWSCTRLSHGELPSPPAPPLGRAAAVPLVAAHRQLSLPAPRTRWRVLPMLIAAAAAAHVTTTTSAVGSWRRCTTGMCTSGTMRSRCSRGAQTRLPSTPAPCPYLPPTPPHTHALPAAVACQVV